MGGMRGGKFGSSHSTVIDTAKPLVKAAARLPEVDKVRAGIIVQCGNGPTRTTVSEVPSGLLFKVRGGRTLQEVYVYTSDKEATRKALAEFVD